MFRISSILAFIILSVSASGSEGKKKEGDDLVFSMFNNLYSFQFYKANNDLVNICKRDLSNDIKDICQANYYWWQIATGPENKIQKTKMIIALDRIIERHGESNPKDLDEGEIFAIIHAFAFKTRLDMHEGKYLTGAKNLNQTIKYLELILNDQSRSNELELLAGLYHYIAGNLLEEYPLFKPLFIFAPRADKEKGLDILLKCLKSDNPLLSTESLYFIIRVKNEINRDNDEAYKMINVLLEKYPENQYFRTLKINILADLGKSYKAADEYNCLLRMNNNSQISEIHHNFLVNESKKYLRKKRIKF